MKDKALVSAFFGPLLFSYCVYSQTNFWERTAGFNGGVTYSIFIDSSARVLVGSVSGVWCSQDKGKSWTNIGLRDLGFVSTILADSQENLIVGTWGYGVYRSRDDGKSWKQVLSAPYVGEIKSDHAGSFFAATTEGLHCSRDNGYTWNRLTLMGSIESVAINKNGDIFAAVLNSGVFKSNNDGMSWSKLDNGIPAQYVLAIETKAANDMVFAGTSGQGAFRSVDDGYSWEPINNGLPGLIVSGFEIGFDNEVFAITNHGLFRSLDNGSHWSIIGINTLTASDGISDVALNLEGEIFVTTGNTGVYSSSDIGANWKQIGLPVVSVHSLALGSSGAIFAGSTGLFRSQDNGQNWIESGPNALVYGIAFDYSNRILIGTNYYSHGSVFRSTAEASWSGCLALDPISQINAVTISSNGDIFAGASGQQEGVYRSNDGCGTWSRINEGLTNQSINAIAINSKDIVYVGTVGGAFQSRDNGDHWVGMPLGATPFAVHAFHIRSDDTMFAGTSHGVFTSVDEGDAWASAGLTNTAIYAVTSNASGQLFAATHNGVYRSTDNGGAWIEINSGLRNLTVQAVAIDSAGHLFVATNGGVFRSVSATVSIEERNRGAFKIYSLEQNYPNPFNSSTIIRYALAKSGQVTMTLFSLTGQKVAVLVNEVKSAGEYSVQWHPKDLPSGVYVYRLQAGEAFAQTQKLLLLK